MSDKVTYRTLQPVYDELRGSRILLRPYRIQDAPALFEAVEESRAHIDPWISFGQGHTTLEQSQDWINQKNARWILREHFVTGIWELATGRYLGDCSLKPQDWDVPSFSMGYWLRTSATGQGFMTEAVQLVTNFAFETFKARRVAIFCDEQNTASASVAKRVGFELEGCFRNERRDANNTLRNTLIFARVAE